MRVALKKEACFLTFKLFVRSFSIASTTSELPVTASANARFFRTNLLLCPGQYQADNIQIRAISRILVPMEDSEYFILLCVPGTRPCQTCELYA